jgi:ABC-2 type transport system ATP-binding protein
MTPVIETTGLRKIFRDFWRRPTVCAVDSLNLTIQPGEVFGLLGPNGSGKSTTIKMLLGLLHPTAGTVSVLGRPPSDIFIKHRIGYLPENTHLHRFLTPRETLHYYGALFGLDRRACRERGEALLEMADLAEVADRPIDGFSKGMARRVGIAQALINAPDLLILDEPTSGLDPVACREVKDLVRALANGGMTVLMTSHLLADVEHVCDRVAIMHRGLVQAEGAVDDLLVRADTTRFLIANLSDAEAEPLRADLAARLNRDVATDHPTVSLETYFLDVVARASGKTSALTHFRPAPFLQKPGIRRAAAESAEREPA